MLIEKADMLYQYKFLLVSQSILTRLKKLTTQEVKALCHFRSQQSTVEKVDWVLEFSSFLAALPLTSYVTLSKSLNLPDLFSQVWDEGVGLQDFWQSSMEFATKSKCRNWLKQQFTNTSETQTWWCTTDPSCLQISSVSHILLQIALHNFTMINGKTGRDSKNKLIIILFVYFE